MAIFMKVDDIDGDVSADGYKKWIEINDCVFGLNRKISIKPGRIQNREISIVTFDDFFVSKFIDKATPYLFLQSCNGNAIATVEIHFCKTGDRPTPFQKLQLHNVLISRYSREANKGGRPIENITFNTIKIIDTYIPFDEKNQAGSPIKAGYDLQTMQKI